MPGETHPEAPSRQSLAIVAGPNGSGKTTFYKLYLAQTYPLFIKADEFSRTLDLDRPEAERSRQAAVWADAERHRLLGQRTSFAFETVFSRTAHWLDFIRWAKDLGYTINLHFICTETPGINVTRIQTRVEDGGHPVPPDKVLKRYPLSMQTALAARHLVDEFWLHDNTVRDRTHLLVARFTGASVVYVGESVPAWARPFLDS